MIILNTFEYVFGIFTEYLDFSHGNFVQLYLTVIHSGTICQINFLHTYNWTLNMFIREQMT